MTINTMASRKRIADYPQPYLAIAGQRRYGDGRDTRETINPATGNVLGTFPLASAGDLADALRVTQESFAEWSAWTAYRRAGLLHAAAQWMRDHSEDGAVRVSLELGKVLPEARTEIGLAASMFDWAADEALRAYGRIIPARRPGLHMEARVRPVGPVYAVTSWNAPANTPARKLAGALAAGCSIILKLSDRAPATGLFLYEALEAAGLPAGVVQMVTGRGAQVSDTIVPSRAIGLVTLTGSVELGRELAAQAGGHLKRQTMELGGHAPVIVDRDIDVQAVARSAARAKFRNTGQVCTAPTRFMIHEDILGEFTAGFVAETRKITVGDPFTDGVDIGPIQNAQQLSHVEGLVADATAKGAVLECGGHRLGDTGYFYTPTVLTSVPDNAETRTIEPFGPIALIEGYSDLKDAVDNANSLSVGLSAYGFTNSASVAHYLSSRLEAGNIILNNWNSSFPETPFGGVQDSGYGREGGIEGLQEFLSTVFVSNEFPTYY